MNTRTTKPKPKPASLDDLIVAWRKAKLAEKEAAAERLQIEQDIQGMVSLKPEGTSTFGNLKIATGFSRSWDSAMLSQIRTDNDINDQFWPFDLEWSEVRRASREIEDRWPDLWKILVPALTTKEKKPSFSLKEI